MTDLTGNLFFEGPAGRLEGILREPAGQFSRMAIVCHPHPLYGGTMHNKVAYRIARSLQREGFAVLRFNFRGVGKSEGRYDSGRGEQDDLRSAIRFMTDRYPDAVLWLGGFSFGAAVTVRTGCANPKVAALIAAGLPVSTTDFNGVGYCARPKLFVQGSLDQYGSLDKLRAFYAEVSQPKQLVVVEGADHFFEGKLDELEKAVRQFAFGNGSE